MCFEFAHSCEGIMIDQINVLLGADRYFMVCIGNLNYLNSSDKDAIEKVKGLLFMNSVVLHLIGEKELIEILDFPDTKPYQKFHGSKLLFNRFVSTWQNA